MKTKTKVRKIGNSYGVILPKEAMEALQVKEGDALYITGEPGENLTLQAQEITFEEKMRIAEEGMRRYENALRELAK
jgi:putative addiction module antidote